MRIPSAHALAIAVVCLVFGLAILALGCDQAGAQEAPTPVTAPHRVSTPFKLASVGFAGLAAADVITTRLAISQGRGSEGNPIYRGSTLKMALIKGGATSGLLFTALSVRQTHPRGALVLVTCYLAGQLAVDAHNLRVGR